MPHFFLDDDSDDDNGTFCDDDNESDLTFRASSLNVGDRVRRGPDWKWGDQDGGAGNAGTITDVDSDGWVRVKWDKGGSNKYRTEKAGGTDLIEATVGEYVVSGAGGICASTINGTYSYTRQHNGAPLYTKEGGRAILYYGGGQYGWRMNDTGNTGDWYYSKEGSSGSVPCGQWTKDGYSSSDVLPCPTVARVGDDSAGGRPQVGATVLVLSASDSSTRSYVGQTGRLLEDDKSGRPFKVEFGDGNKWWFKEGELQKVGSLQQSAHRQTPWSGSVKCPGCGMFGPSPQTGPGGCAHCGLCGVCCAKPGRAQCTKAQLCVGARVRVKRSVSNPTYGWGGVTHDKVGIVKRVDPDGDLKVDFPDHSGWTGKSSEMELVTASTTVSTATQDSGGQDVFLSVLDLLHAPKASVSMLVFSLPDLQNPNLFKNSIAQLRVQLDSFAVHASESPLLLVGTRKDEAVAAGGGGHAALKGLSDELIEALDARLREVRLKMPLNGDLCFFPIENSKGFAGDETIRELVGAIEEAAMELDSMKERVPAGWLAVYDALALEMSATPPRQQLSLAEVTAIASRFGLPHDPARLPLEQEVQQMLSHFHSLGAVCWYDLPEAPEVRELVVLDPQWIIDAVSMIICNFDDSDHRKLCHTTAGRKDQRKMRDLCNDGVLHHVLLEFLWEDKRFKAHKAELLKLMEHFGLVVPIRRKDQHQQSAHRQTPWSGSVKCSGCGIYGPSPQTGPGGCAHCGLCSVCCAKPGRAHCTKAQQTYFVPALLALRGSEGANQPPTPTNAPLATLYFALESQSPPSTAPVWAPEDFLPDSGGFLPDGAFFELCGAAVGWSYDTAIGFTPRLGFGFAHVKFGRDELLLSRSDGAPYITVAILNAGADSPSAWSPAIDRLRLLVRHVSSRFVNLRCTCLLPLSSVDKGEERHVERGALLAADIDGSQVYYVVGRQQLTTRELASRLSAYLPPLKPPDHYGAFLSYSHVPAFDTPFTEKLADCLGAQSPLVTTFLDKRTVSRGTDLDVVRLLAMANSRVIVPIVTWNALRRMTSLTSNSGLDYLLLEWSFALLQHEHGAAVLPIFIGASDADGSADPSKDLFAAHPPMARADGWGNALDDAGRVQADVRSVWERVPDVVVESVARSLESFYTKHELEPPTAIRTRTAREVVRSISEIWGGETTWELTARAFTRKATRTLSKILGKTPSSFLFGAAGRAEPGVRTHELLGQVDGPCPWGLPEAIAQRVSKAVHNAEHSEPPKLLGQSKPAPPANEGETGKAIEAALLEKVMTSDDH
ncbi:gtp-binding protein [Chrysochromulina tobinii]|uniref:Gtp-binding protein n=1 Tax=Chrysochromulina tobinii TaxID=1460289 RepID=A0A0M0JK68_9EUKA|nr:gtp-binding protein [Chrysochromulina tobinii]|eukprot:KOO26944.1 gtp-binding protein [Chrysochromulina sp. CCMP291]